MIGRFVTPAVRAPQVGEFAAWCSLTGWRFSRVEVICTMTDLQDANFIRWLVGLRIRWETKETPMIIEVR